MILAAALAAEEEGFGVDVHHAVPVGFGDVDGVVVGAEAGVVDEDVEAAVVALGGGEDGFYFVEVGDVAGEGVGFAAGFLDFLLEGFEFGEVAGGEGDFGAGLGEGEGEAAADAFAGAGDEGDLVLDVEGVGGHGKGRIN